MAKTVFYRQCRLARPTTTGRAVQVTWIPDRFAVVGNVLRLRGGGRVWENGWVVLEAGRNRLSQDDLPDFHELSKAHLKASGDAEPARN